MYLLLTEEVAKGKLNNICFIHDWCDKITNVYERSVFRVYYYIFKLLIQSFVNYDTTYGI